MPKQRRKPADAHQIVWRNPSHKWYEVRLICACGAKFRNGANDIPAEEFWQIHHNTLTEGNPS